MIENRLRVMQWAKDAGLAPGVVYGFLHGQTRQLAPQVEQALAKAARTSVKILFGEE